ncbi:unnamed protein product, partial [Musa acuminata var. zebrina]
RNQGFQIVGFTELSRPCQPSAYSSGPRWPSSSPVIPPSIESQASRDPEYGFDGSFSSPCGGIGGGVRVELDGRDTTTGAREKSIVRVVLAGVLGMRAVAIAVMFSNNIIDPKATSYYLLEGCTHLSLGLACGLGGFSAGVARGLDRDAGVRYIFSDLIWFPCSLECFTLAFLI